MYRLLAPLALLALLTACVAPGRIRTVTEAPGTYAVVEAVDSRTGALSEAAALEALNDQLSQLPQDEPMDFGDYFEILGPVAFALLFGREGYKVYRDRRTGGNRPGAGGQANGA